MERWKLTFQELSTTPQWVVDDMLLVMQAESEVDSEPQPKG